MHVNCSSPWWRVCLLTEVVCPSTPRTYRSLQRHAPLLLTQKSAKKNQTWKRNEFHKVIHYTLCDMKKLVKSCQWDVDLYQVSNVININFLRTKSIHPKSVRVLWSFIKFSQLILAGNELGSVWRIRLWILGLKEVHQKLQRPFAKNANPSLHASVASSFHLPLFCSCTNTWSFLQGLLSLCWKEALARIEKYGALCLFVWVALGQKR